MINLRIKEIWKAGFFFSLKDDRNFSYRYSVYHKERKGDKMSKTHKEDYNRRTKTPGNQHS